MDDKMIQRINELARKMKTEGLNDAEKEEQRRLRAEYVAAFRRNLRSELETIRIVKPDGTVINVKERHDARYQGEEY